MEQKMSAAVLERIIELADQLTPEERALLVARLQSPIRKRSVVRLGGSWTQYWIGDSDDFDSLLKSERERSLERTMRQIEGNFAEDDHNHA
jgi:hypothetical protein